MNKKLLVVMVSLTLVLVCAVASYASGMFVATAKNFRGAMYQGVGPTPAHACENAIVKCSQDSFIPPSCQVIAVRMECPPPACFVPPPMPPMQRPIRKTHVRPNVPAGYSWGRPME